MTRAVHLSRRDAMLLFGGAALSAPFGASLPALAQGGEKRGGILRVSASTNPSSLDPTTGGSGNDHVYLFTLYDTLIEWDYATLKPKPGLAESWTFADPQTLVLTLRQGITFHDGTPLNADIVKFNLDRNKADVKSNVKADLASLASVEVLGPYRVALKLNAPDATLPSILSDRAGMMVSPDAVKAGNGNINRAPVGTGAYSFVSWSDGEKIIVKRNDKYWKPNRPLPDGIEFSIITDITTGLRSLNAGQNDFIYALPARQKAIVGRSPNLNLVEGPTLFVSQIYLNWAKPPFNDIRVRRAFNYAVDREAFLKGAFAGFGEVAHMNLPKSHWAYEESVAKMYPYDPAKARALLSEAGLKEGSVVELGGTPTQDNVQQQEIMIEQFRKVGLALKFRSAPGAEMAGSFFGAEKRVPGFLSAWTGRPDPSQTYSLMFSKDAYYNAGRAPVPAELEAAIQASRASGDIDERKKAFSTIQRIVMDNAFVVPLVFQYELSAMTKKVRGYRSGLLGKPKFEDVWLES